MIGYISFYLLKDYIWCLLFIGVCLFSNNWSLDYIIFFDWFKDMLKLVLMINKWYWLKMCYYWNMWIKMKYLYFKLFMFVIILWINVEVYDLIIL